MNKLTAALDDFTFRIEPEKKTIFDPIIEGVGSLSIKNASIKIRVECREEHIKKANREISIPVLQLQELEVSFAYLFTYFFSHIKYLNSDTF